MLVFGTRPEAIKMAPLVKEFQKYPEQFKTIVCVTGQHRQMLDSVLDLFDIEPDYDLNIMKHGQDLYDVTSRVLLGLREVLNNTKPDIVLVHGDTSTSTASALAAFYQQISVGHIEAGLRTFNLMSPWPEEANRQITSRITKYHFAPTELSKRNLLKENIDEENITVTGNTVIDALHWVINKSSKDKNIQSFISSEYIKAGLSNDIINNNNRKVLITGHRRENFGDGFINICKAIKTLGDKFKDVDFIYPMHLNPNVREPIMKVFDNSLSLNSNVHFIEPLDYLPFVSLLEKSFLVLTDSGGIQEEAPSLGKPVLVMRDTTERPEALESGTVRLVGTSYDKIIHEVEELLVNPDYYNLMSNASNPYGDGTACKKIVASML